MANGGIIGPINDPVAFTITSTTQSFTASGTFTSQAYQNTAIVMLVAGGGGGAGRYGGGGGAGGMVLTPACGIPVSPSTAYPIVIGAGGPSSGPPSFLGSPGVDSTGFGLTAKGGGGGNHAGGGGTPGGSGGGSGQNSPTAGVATQPTQPGNSGTYGFGSASGTGASCAPAYGHAGGGGASAVGGNGTPTAVGAGGAGKDVTSIFGAAPQPFYGPTSGVYAGGGAGGSITGLTASGGPGGGGSSASPGTAATVNTGGGGGGSTGNVSTAGGAGGSGIAIVKTNPTSGVNAPGVWSLSEQYNYKKNNQWT